jgi:hypothetical protein
VGPVLFSAEIIPPEIKRYVLASDPARKIHTNPDTLVVTLSESIAPGNGDDPWETLFLYTEECSESGTGTPLLLHAAPVVDPFDSLIIKVPVLITEEGTKVQVGDCLFPNPVTVYADEAGNRPAALEVEVKGEESEFSNFKTVILRDIIGDPGLELAQFNIPQTDDIYLVDDAGNVIERFGAGSVDQWIPPLYMTDEGEIDMTAQESCNPSRKQDTSPRPFPRNCLSAVVVISEEAYTADVNVYDNLGKHIHSSLQKFGYCGEQENLQRAQPGGLMSFLIWNQKNTEGNFVGSGVYIWKVVYKFENGGGRTETYRQGIARGEDPMEGCAVSQ